MAAVPTVTRWWAGRSDPQRIDLYTRWSFYTFIGASPLFAVMALGSSPGPWPPGAALFVVGSVAVAAAAILLARAGLDGRALNRPLPVALTAATAVLAVATAIVGVAALPDWGRDAPGAPWSLALPPTVVLIACATVWPTRRLVPASMCVGALVVAGLLVGGQDPVEAVVIGVSLTVAVTGIVLSFRFTVWVLDVVVQLERARDVQSQLAVAEERLRFARDLHDVMGRNLSAIAVKGQLAGELVRRGRPEAAEEVADIARIAEESLREVRGVVGGYRGADLAGELAGARSLLRAAGVACTVAGEEACASLPLQMQTAFGWVVREAVTNVLRHSRATSCSISLDVGGHQAQLSVVNDGAVTGGPATERWGHGLTGLAERLAATGGRLTARREDGRFVLAATVPTQTPVPTETSA